MYLGGELQALSIENRFIPITYIETFMVKLEDLVIKLNAKLLNEGIHEMFGPLPKAHLFSTLVDSTGFILLEL